MGVYQEERYQDNWCELCQFTMELFQKQHCALPARLVERGLRNISVRDFKKFLVKIDPKLPVPQGKYPCAIRVFRCPECGRRRARLSVVMPDEDREQVLLFERRELDDFLNRPE